MNILVKIDHRENKLKEDIKQSLLEVCNDISVEFDNLYCGDFIIEVNDVPFVVVERKTLSDLVASIKDGRYRVQKDKLCSNYTKDCLIYLIEGSLDWSSDRPKMIDGMEKSSLISSILNTQFRDDLRVIHTNNIQDTHDWIVALVTRLHKDPSKYLKTTSNTVVCNKEDMITKNRINNKEDLFYYQLTQVPGISGKTAQAFVDNFHNMKQFYEDITPLDDEEKLKLLKNIMIEDKQKKRRISSKVAENIVKYMF